MKPRAIKVKNRESMPIDEPSPLASLGDDMPPRKNTLSVKQMKQRNYSEDPDFALRLKSLG